MKKSISVNMVFNAAYKLLNILFPFVTSVYLSRVLGPEKIGSVSYAQNIMQYFLIFASMGIPTYGIRQIAKCAGDRESLDRTFSELLTINLISSVICSTAYTLLILINTTFRAELKLYLCAGLTLYLNILNIDWFYSGREEYVYITVRSFFVKLISIVAIFVFIKSKDDYTIYALITSLAITGNYFFNVINLRGKVSFRLERKELRKHLKPVLVLLTVMFATDLYNQIDVTMLGAMTGNESVGLYSYPVKIVRIVTGITTAISATVLPRMCLYFGQGNRDELKQLFVKTLKLVLMLAVPACLGIFTVSEKLVQVLWSESFKNSSQILRCLSIIILVISVSYLSVSVVLTATNNEKYLLRATLTGAVTNIVCNWVLIRSLGAEGAAIASVISEFAVLAVHLHYAKPYISFRTGRNYIISLVTASAVMTAGASAMVALINNNIASLCFAVAVGVALFAAVLAVMKNDTFYLTANRLLGKLKKNQGT